jgi:hypothetical protein
LEEIGQKPIKDIQPFLPVATDKLRYLQNQRNYEGIVQVSTEGVKLRYKDKDAFITPFGKVTWLERTIK